MSGKLYELLGLESHELVSITGAGGKTTLAFLLCAELAAAGRHALVTTTTKMWYPSDFDGTVLIGEDADDIARQAATAPAVFAAARTLDNGKVKGFERTQVDALFEALPNTVILNEADGAAMKPCKFYGPNEPVIPVRTTLLVHVVGAEVLDAPMDDSMFHRVPPERQGSIFDAQEFDRWLGSFVRKKLAGMTCRRILIVNKADGGRQDKAQHLCAAGARYFDACIAASLHEGRWTQ